MDITEHELFQSVSFRLIPDLHHAAVDVNASLSSLLCSLPGVSGEYFFLRSSRENLLWLDRFRAALIEEIHVCPLSSGDNHR
jgi:hypothetical protein